MANATATVTGKTGAGLTMTAQAFNDIIGFTLDPNARVVHLIRVGGVVVDVDISADTTLTITGVSTGLFAITIS